MLIYGGVAAFFIIGGCFLTFQSYNAYDGSNGDAFGYVLMVTVPAIMLGIRFAIMFFAKLAHFITGKKSLGVICIILIALMGGINLIPLLLLALEVASL